MNYKDSIKDQPLVLTILPTHRCSAACKNCCFGCTPKIKHRMTYDEIIRYMDQAVEFFPSIQVCVFTGGECFLIGDDLDKCVNYATKLGLSTRVVTNGYWANSYETAYNRLQSLIDNGLKEINFSTGDDHQEYVKLDNIANGVRAAIDLGLRLPIHIALESSSSAKFKAKHLDSNECLSKLIEEKKVNILSAAWITFKSEELYSKDYDETQMEFEGCDNLFRTISINPYSQLLACCGLTAEYNKFLKLGNLQKYSIEDLYNAQFEDIYKLWLYTLGPKHIYNTVTKHRGIKSNTFNHNCTYCIEAVKNEENINAIRETLSSQIPAIFFKLESMNLIKK